MTVLLSSGLAANKTEIPLSGVIAGVGSGVGIGTIANFMGNGYFTNCVGAGAVSAVAGAALSTMKNESELTKNKPTLFSNVMIGSSIGALVGASSNSLVSGYRKPYIPLSVGAALLGTNLNEDHFDFDCWKPILHDNSTEKSKGKFLINVIIDHRVKSVNGLNPRKAFDKTELIVENIWNEKFKISFFIFENKLIFAHADKI
ncbi:unnamed protein product [Brachionus calyciflorus]|uniref:Uncharacterized protein n=1 Tax=Brachionus calyciflorus TaxID=104777 RepID=A0A813M1I0_9BILA|nr:unnamed protein product [Brachionus calyciflorus]